MQQKSILLGALFTLLSAFSYSSQTAFIKGHDFSVPVLVFFQSLVSLVLLTPILIKRYGFSFLNIAQFSEIKMLHVWRTLFSMGISYFLFIALTMGSYFNAMLLYNLFPVVTPIVSYFILKQYIRKKAFLFIIVAFIGAALTLNLERGILSPASIFAVLSAICTAASITMIKKIATQDNSLKSLYFYFLISTVVAGVVASFFKSHIAFNPNLIFHLILVGLLFFIVQYFLVLGTTYANPVVVSVTYYSNILFSLLFSVLFFQDHLSVKVMAGMVLILFGGVGVIIENMTPKKSFERSHERRIK